MSVLHVPPISHTHLTSSGRAGSCTHTVPVEAAYVIKEMALFKGSCHERCFANLVLFCTQPAHSEIERDGLHDANFRFARYNNTNDKWMHVHASWTQLRRFKWLPLFKQKCFHFEGNTTFFLPSFLPVSVASCICPQQYCFAFHSSHFRYLNPETGCPSFRSRKNWHHEHLTSAHELIYSSGSIPGNAI